MSVERGGGAAHLAVQLVVCARDEERSGGVRQQTAYERHTLRTHTVRVTQTLGEAVEKDDEQIKLLQV